MTLLTAPEAARIVNLSTRNFRQKLIEGQIPATKTATGWLIEASDLAAFRASRPVLLAHQLELPGPAPSGDYAPRGFRQRIDRIMDDFRAGRVSRADAIQLVLAA